MNLTFPVPRIVHQMWRSTDLPPLIKLCVDSVVEKNPDWSLRFYTDEDIEQSFPELEEISLDEFRKIPTGIEKSHAFRAAILHLHGGIYCDVDIQAIESFDRLSERLREDFLTGETELWLTTDHPIHSARIFGRKNIVPHFIVAKPGAKFLRLYLREVAKRSREGSLGGDSVHSTGSVMLTDLLIRHGGPEQQQMKILPFDLINPLPDMTMTDPEISVYARLVKEGIWRERLKPSLVHYWWHSYSERTSNFDMFGERLFYGQP